MIGEVKEGWLDAGDVGAGEWVDAVDEEALDADAATGDVALDASDGWGVGAGELHVALGTGEHGELEASGLGEANDGFGGFAFSKCEAGR